MTNSLKASTQGLATVDLARQRRGWTKTSTACWWQDAHTSRATLRRFWRGERIQQDAFIAICQAVGISNWQTIAELSETLDPQPQPNLPLIDWDEAPDLANFYGRSQELEQLEQWIITDRCKLVAIFGLAGIGKTALALAIAERLQYQFDYLIWRSLTYEPSLFDLLDSTLYTFEQTAVQDVGQSTLQLRNQLKKHRCLLVLDGLEAVLQKQENIQEYDQFLRALSLNRHQSCILLTSREKPPGFTAIAANSPWVNCLSLQGLEPVEALELLEAGGLKAKKSSLLNLGRFYSCNPLALKTIIPLIQSLFAGNVTAFLEQNTLVLGNQLQALLQEQFQQLSDSEREIAYWLAIWQEPISLWRLQSHVLPCPNPALILEALTALEKRSLLEKRLTEDEQLFTLQPLVMKVVTEQLIEQAVGEINQVMQSQDICHCKVLRTHRLLRPGTDDIAGDRLLSQIEEQLWRICGSSLPKQLLQILSLLENSPPLAVGYIGCNLLVMLKRLNSKG